MTAGRLKIWNEDAGEWEYPPGGTTVGSNVWGEASTAKFSGDGSPVGVVTPTSEGDLYVDSTTPALWQAIGTGDTDWQEVSGGGSMPLLGKRTLTATEIYSLDTIPVEIVPAPDPDVTLIPDKALYRFIPGTIPFVQTLPLGWLWGEQDTGSTVQVPVNGTDETVSFHSPFNDLDSTFLAVVDILGQGLFATASSPMPKAGAITAVSGGSVGADYAPGDTGTITQDASNDATYEVDTVDGSGGITGLILTDGGTAYLAQNASLTNGGAQPGIGAGGSVVIDSTDESVVADGEVEVIFYGISTTDL